MSANGDSGTAGSNAWLLQIDPFNVDLLNAMFPDVPCPGSSLWPRQLYIDEEHCLFTCVEAEPSTLFSRAWQFLNNKHLFIGLALNLTGKAVEKIFDILVTNRDSIDPDFVACVYTKFLPAYIKRRSFSYSWFVLHLLFKARKAHPLQFRMLLRAMLKDIEISSCILDDYVINCDEMGQAKFMDLVREEDLSSEHFIHNISAIYSAFIGCVRTADTFEWALSVLQLHARAGRNNRDYGQLLLAFVRDYTGIDGRYRDIRALIDCHASPYKSSCVFLIEQPLRQQILLMQEIQPRTPEPLDNGDSREL